MTESGFPALPPQAPREGRRTSWPLIVFIVVALAGAGLFSYGLVSLFGYHSVLIPSGGMGTTIPKGSSAVYRVDSSAELHRGDIIIFEGAALDETVRGRLLKRVVAVGGDTVRCCDDRHRIQVNGKSVAEPYVQNDSVSPDPEILAYAVKVPADTVFVLGDVRNNSNDSRFHPENGRQGAIPRSQVDGVVIGTGTVFSFQPLAPTTAFTDAGLPGTTGPDNGYTLARWGIAGGAGLVLLGIIGVIVSVVRSAGRRRRAAAVPPTH